MVRTAFFVLLLANLLVFAWAQGYFGGGNDGREGGRMASQLNPDKIKLAVVEKDVLAAALLICRAIDGLALRDAERLGTVLADGNAGIAATVKPLLEPTGYWVLIPALATRSAAERKSGEVKALGVTGFQVREDPTGGYAVVFGMLGSETEATQLLAELGKKGVKSARIEPREKVPERGRLEVRGPAPAVAKRLAEAAPAMAGVTVGDCP